jgi:hypothetical protein
MLDPQAILDQARAGDVPESWHVYRTSRFYIILWTVLPFDMAIILVFGLTSTPWMRLLSSGDLGLMILTGCQLAIGLAVIPLVVRLLVTQVRELRTADRQLFVVTPDGFVQRRSNGRYSTLVLSFADQQYTPLRATFGRVGKRALLLSDEGGQLIEWHPDPQFRPAGQIVEQILAAYAAYTAEHGGAH